MEINFDNWFKKYDKWVHQAERKEELGLEWIQEDDVLGVTYHSKRELLLCAEEMSKQAKLAKTEYLQSLRNKT